MAWCDVLITEPGRLAKAVHCTIGELVGDVVVENGIAKGKLWFVHDHHSEKDEQLLGESGDYKTAAEAKRWCIHFASRFCEEGRKALEGGR